MFPVVNSQGIVIGTIPRNFIIVLIKTECYYDPQGKSIVEDLTNTSLNKEAKNQILKKDKTAFTRL